jgi:triosephosphate isomerase
MRRPIIAANWKMNKTISEAIEFANGLKRFFYNQNNLDIAIFPPFTALSEVRDVILDSNILLGAQNIHWEEMGAFTGEVSALQIKDAGCKFVILGHSERRHYFSETNEIINKKVRLALRFDLNPILCIGENLDEREKGLTLDIIREQLEVCLKGIDKTDILNLVIAYEPVWAIGTGKNATGEQADSVHKFIRNLLERIYSKEISEMVRIQYGGSVNPENIIEFAAYSDIDGALVGGASLNLESFIQIVEKFSSIRCLHS